MPLTRTDRYLLTALVLLGLVLKSLWLGRNELAHDEPFTVVMAHRGITDLFAQLREENNPPLHFLITHFWCKLVPLDAGWMRFPSAVFSALAVWPLFLLARATATQRVALIAALFFTFSNYHYGFAHEVRAYALFTLLAVAFMWQLWRMANAAPRAVLWATLIGLAMVYTHFFGWLLLGTAAICAHVVPSFRPARRSFWKSFAIIAIGFLPYALVFLSRLGTSIGQGTWLSRPEPEELYNMIWRWSNAPVLAVLFLLLITIGSIRVRAKTPAVALGLVWTMVPLTGMFLASYFAPIFLDRYLVYAAPAYALLVAAAIGHLGLPQRWAHWPGAMALVGMAFTFTPWKSNDLHPSAVLAQVETWKQTDTVVLLQPWWYMNTYAWHSDPILVSDAKDLQHMLANVSVFPITQIETVPDSFGASASVILVDAGADLVDPDRTVINALRASYQIVDSVEADRNTWVYRFRR